MIKRFFIIIRNLIKYNLLYIESRILSFYSSIADSCYYSNKLPFFSRIVIYGFGPYGEFAFVNLFKSHYIVDIFDLNNKKFGNKVKSPEFINKNDFDYVVVTVLNKVAQKDVYSFLKRKGIDDNKIIYVVLKES